MIEKGDAFDSRFSVWTFADRNGTEIVHPFAERPGDQAKATVGDAEPVWVAGLSPKQHWPADNTQERLKPVRKYDEFA